MLFSLLAVTAVVRLLRTLFRSDPPIRVAPHALAPMPALPLDTDAHFRDRLLAEYNRLLHGGPKGRSALVAPLPLWTARYRRNGEFRPEILAAVPRLQAAMVATTAYSPGKWLLEQELSVRHRAPDDPAPTWDPGAGVDVFDAAAEARLCGIGLSGGGIRSATFCLGVLQALSGANKLESFDYISSVSGGGYIHQWLASWIWNEPGGFHKVACQLTPVPTPGCPARTPEQITWLRRYASYLTPSRGFLSLDTWTLVTTWLRNTTLNQIILFSFLGLIILLIQFAGSPFMGYEEVYRPVVGHNTAPDLRLVLATPFMRTALPAVEGAGVVLSFALLFSVWYIGRAFRLLDCSAGKARSSAGPLRAGQVALFISLPGLLCAYLLALQTLLRLDTPLLHRKPLLGIWCGYIALLLGSLTLQSAKQITRRSVLFALMAIGPSLVVGSLALWVLLPSADDKAKPPVQSTAPLPKPPLPSAQTCTLSYAAPAHRSDTPTVTEHCTAVLSAAGASPVTEEAAQTVLTLPHAHPIPFAYYSPRCWPPGVKEPSSLQANDVFRARDSRLYCLAASLADSGNRYLVKNEMLPRSALFASREVRYLTPGCLLAVFGPALFFFLQFLAFRLHVGLLGNFLSESRREWLARLGAVSVTLNLVWTALGAVVLFAPILTDAFLAASPGKKIFSTAGILAAHAVTLYSGSSSKTDGKPNPKAWFGYSALDLVGVIGAPLCILLLLLIAGGIADSIVGKSLCSGLGLAAVLLTLFLVLGSRVNVNDFSMAPFYRSRLARCYLGGNNPERTPDPFTGFDDHEQAVQNTDFPLQRLRPVRFGGQPIAVAADQPARVYNGPFPIFNATVNLTFGQDLAWQERKGTSFAFTPLFSGYHVGWTAEAPPREAAEAQFQRSYTTFNGFVPTASFAYRGEGIDLPTVAAMSGAALSPNAGFSTQPALAFLMTLFNVRLGWWIANPRRPSVATSDERQPSPTFGPRYLLSELFGFANDTTNFVNLCDGGRFDNMGLFELVRRRCSLIVICDGEMDVDTTFEGIGLSIAKCRTDFGVEIDLDLHPLEPDATTRLSKAHFVKGTIRYPAPPGGDSADPRYTGTLIYCKTALTGNEPADILHYKREHPDFPQESTLNQWFTETQFESYRRLGQLIGTEAAKAF